MFGPTAHGINSMVNMENLQQMNYEQRIVSMLDFNRSQVVQLVLRPGSSICNVDADIQSGVMATERDCRQRHLLQGQVNSIASLAFNTVGTLQRDAPPNRLSPNYPEPPPAPAAENLESESTTPDVPVKKLETSFQEFSETTCAKVSLVTEVPKAVADDSADDFSDEEEWLFHGIPQVTPGYLDSSESKTLEVPEQKAENDMQGFREATCTKESLVTEVSKPVANGFACRATKLYLAGQTKPENESPKSILNLSRPSEVPLFSMEINSTALNCISRDTSAVNQWSSVSVQQQPAKPTNFAYNSVSMPAKSNKVKIRDKISQAPTDSQVRPAKIQIIELSDDDDDDEEEKPSTIQPVHQKTKPPKTKFRPISRVHPKPHSGLIKEGIQRFDIMISKYELVPNSEHYAITVDLLGRMGELNTALDVINNMPMQVGPDIWGASLSACRQHQNMKM
ncbi:hypothetical protein KIW84_032799 [Lathyrus oleraceus]|uniref:Pentatricopeptide repeat-containing protein n=1 Tax=Pisum sativum TaxID=3888 RepID=A0A9D4XV78_PEA|nr:hypothetical protein KIW84_032799 [Pisum sativum]